MRIKSYLNKTILIILTLIPLILLVYQVLKYHVDAPYLDQWSLIPLLEKSFGCNLSVKDLWLQHNEHRLIFPQLIMIVLARLSYWNILYELLFSIFLAVIIFFLLAYQINITLKKLNITGNNWLIPCLSIIVFSLAQSQNWLWGWQIQIFLNLLAVIVGINLLTNPPLNPTKLLAAGFCGIISAYSFANGNLFWIIGLLLILTFQFTEKKLNIQNILFWLFISSISFYSYIFGYQSPESHPPLNSLLKYPINFIGYIFNYLGSPLNNHSQYVFGIAGLLLWSSALIFLIFKKHNKIEFLLPYIALSVYALLSAIITGIARVGFGPSQALASRYVTFSNLFWISILVFFFILIKDRSIKKYQSLLFSIIFITLIVFYSINSINSINSFKNWKNFLNPAKDDLKLKRMGQYIIRLSPNEPYLIFQRGPLLEKRKLSVFRK